MSRAILTAAGTLVLVQVLGLAAAPPVVVGAAAEGGSNDYPSPVRGLWSLTAFGGVHDDSRLTDILSFRGREFESSYLAGLALKREVAESFDHLKWELEGSVFQHFGNQTHVEGNLAVLARWTRFPWDSFVDTSIAVGQGISLAAEPPPIEQPDTRRLLHYTSLEAEFAPPGDSRWSVVGRIHHRSGVFGLYDATGASNFQTLGVRVHF